MGVRIELVPQQSGKRAYLPPSCYTLSRKEKISFCECLSGVKVPSRYSSNPKNFVSMKDLKLVENYSNVSNTLKWLAYGPDIPVRSYQAFDVNGYTFYIKCQDDKSTVQNSGVSVEASSTEFKRGNSIKSRDIKESYGRVIEEIWELDYKDVKVSLFSGYAARRTKWCVDDPIASLTGYESTNSSALSSELTGRSYDWIRARTKPQEGGDYYFTNDKTKEVFDKMGELQRQVSDGSWTSEGHNDILSRALGKTKHSGLVLVDELATITQEITKKVQKKFEEKMNEMMNSKLEGTDIIGEEEEGDKPQEKVQVPKKVESKGSVTPIKKTPPLLDDDINSSEHCQSLPFLLNKRPPTKKSESVKMFKGRLESFSVNSIKPKNSIWKKIKKIMPQKNYEKAWS
ncbi:hypothetical protein AgCh_020343 [Apium graveolens]